MKKITLVDYGLGNLHSVTKSFSHLGCEVEIDSDGSRIAGAAKLVLPGVGAFSDGMAGLRQHGQVEALRQSALRGTPLLGICLGAQLLLERSEEFGSHEGLGLVPGTVQRIPADGVKVPHIGWARLLPPLGRDAFPGILHELTGGTWSYFIHSYEMRPAHPEHLSAVCRYGTHTITAAIQRGAIHGLQFHPEKSGESGLTVLRTFALL